MDLETRMADGTPVTLTVRRDRFGVQQVVALITSGCMFEVDYLCTTWGRRSVDGTVREGILTAEGQIFDVPESDWLEALAERDDARAREDLPDIRLVRIISRGNRVTIEGYTLSARVDRATWAKIAPHMVEVDSSENDEILEGDRFIGWIIHPGHERQVEDLLGVKPETRQFAGS